MVKKDQLERYNLPREIKFCKKCTISNHRPRITFDENGVCSACNYAEFKKKVNWQEREKELVELCNRFRRSDGSHDVIVPASGGKDSSYVAHILKHKYGMNPLTVTWAPLLITDIGRQNWENFIDSGFDNIRATPNGRINRLITKLSFTHLGDPFQPFIYGVTNFPLRVAIEKNISLIMYGENGEVEYGGDMKNAYKPTREITDHNKHYFSGMPPEAWAEYGIKPNDLMYYMAPDFEKIIENKTEIHFMGYYRYWDPQENFNYCLKNTGFQCNTERTEGTYSKYASLDDKLDGVHYYLGFIKFGIGRATSDSAHEIRDGRITREKGIKLVKEYDDEFPSKYFKDFLQYCDVTEEEFWKVVDMWRSDKIWENYMGKWRLRKAVWNE